MGLLLLIARLVLAVVFIAAGIAKLADLPGSRRAVAEFGVGGRLAEPIGRVLPLVEVAVGAALIPTLTARYGALAAVLLLLLFVVAIGLALVRGRQPECHCFGQLHSASVGWWTLLRDFGLIGVAALVLAAGWSDGGSSGTAWIARLDATQVVGLVGGALVVATLGFLGWFSLQLLRQNGRLLVRVEALEARLGGPLVPERLNGAADGLPIGSRAPVFALPDLDGVSHRLESLLRLGRPVMLVFADPDCDPCRALLSEIGGWQHEHANELTIVLVSRGDPAENRVDADQHRLGIVLLQEDREVAERYRAYGTPSAVLIDREGAVGPLAGGADAVRELLAEAIDQPLIVRAQSFAGYGAASSPARAIAVGDHAPALDLPDLDGHLVSLSALQGGDSVLLFWNPACGFCQQMLEDLRRWEGLAEPRAPRLVLISSGDAETNRAQGLASPILLDEQGVAMRLFGAAGTPMALRLDAAGRIASPLAAGATAVFELATAARERVPMSHRDGSVV